MKGRLTQDFINKAKHDGKPDIEATGAGRHRRPGSGRAIGGVRFYRETWTEFNEADANLDKINEFIANGWLEIK
jgi:hypothetical protein